MSIEENLERLCLAVEGIQIAVEKLAGNAPMPDVKAPADNDDDDAAPEKPTETAAEAKKRVQAEKRKTAAAAKKKAAAEKVTDADDSTPEKGDVRTALRRLQAATSPDKVKALLKKAGATGVGDLEVDKYQKLIDAANKAADAAE